MTALFLILATVSQAASPPLEGNYVAVTETEYAIELKLEPSGRAQLEFRTWEADDAASPSTESFKGTWSRSDSNVMVQLLSGKSATFTPVTCLSYQEFAQTGCSAGLKLVKTTMPDRYGLQRFGLWRSESLRVQP